MKLLNQNHVIFKLRPTSRTKRSSRYEPTTGVSFGLNTSREVDRRTDVANGVVMWVHSVSGTQFPGMTISIQHHIVQKTHSRAVGVDPLTETLEHHIPSVMS